MTSFEEVAAELDAMDDASGRKASDATGNGPAVQYWLGRQCAYREAAALVRARALPAMDREGLAAELCADYAAWLDGETNRLRLVARWPGLDESTRKVWRKRADAILARFAPPAPVVTDAMVEAGARACYAEHCKGRERYPTWETAPGDARERAHEYARACLTAALGTPQPDDEARNLRGAADLLKLLRQRGCIVSTSAVPPDAVAHARADGCVHVDADGFGYVWTPKEPFAQNLQAVEPLQRRMPARAEVGDVSEEVFQAYLTGTGSVRVHDFIEYERGVRSGLRAAFAAAGVVPAEKYEAARYAHAHALEDLAAATKRAETSERRLRDLEQSTRAPSGEHYVVIDGVGMDEHGGYQTIDGERHDMSVCEVVRVASERLRMVGRDRDEARAECDRLHAEWRECADALAVAAMQRDEARAVLAGRVTPSMREALVDAFMRSTTPAEDTTFGWFADTAIAVFTAVFGAPVAEPAPAPVTREQFEALCEAVGALLEGSWYDSAARQVVVAALKRAKSGV